MKNTRKYFASFTSVIIISLLVSLSPVSVYGARQVASRVVVSPEVNSDYSSNQSAELDLIVTFRQSTSSAKSGYEQKDDITRKTFFEKSRVNFSKYLNKSKASRLSALLLDKKNDLTLISGVLLSRVSKAELEILKNSPDIAKILKDEPISTDLDIALIDQQLNKARSTILLNSLPVDGTGVKIAMIDTGVDWRNPEFGNCFGSGCKVIGGWDYVGGDSDPFDDSSSVATPYHGTSVSYVAAGDGKLKGVANKAKLLVYRVTNSSHVYQALNQAVLDGASVINMSISGSKSLANEDTAAVENVVSGGVSVVVSAGNDAPNPLFGYAAAPSAITVASAIRSDYQSTYPGFIYSSSSPGSNNNKPDIAAVGYSVCTVKATADTRQLTESYCSGKYGSNYALRAGTSMAAPMVAGSVALIKQAIPNATPAEIKFRLLDSAVPFPGVSSNLQGKGLLNIYGALSDKLSSLKGPNFSQAGVVNGASFKPELASKGLASIFGTELATCSQASNTLPLPTDVCGTQIKINGIFANLLYVSPTQVNFALPSDLPVGGVYMQVKNNTSDFSPYVNLYLKDSAPGLFSRSQSGAGLASAQTYPDYKDVSSTNAPCRTNGLPCNIVIVYATDLGTADKTKITATIGGVPATVDYAGSQGQFVGLDQINIFVPSTLSANTNPGYDLQVCVIGGMCSNTVLLPVN